MSSVIASRRLFRSRSTAYAFTHPILIQPLTQISLFDRNFVWSDIEGGVTSPTESYKAIKNPSLKKVRRERGKMKKGSEYKNKH